MSTDQKTVGSRSGSLNGALWGVSRWTGNDNPSGTTDVFNWADSTQNQCGTSVQVSDTSDINVCDGATVESQNDNQVVQNLAMYPRQPFNFAGRTGVVEFNVSDNSASSHAAWPTMVIADQPVPAPYSDSSVAQINARDSIGIDLVGSASSNPHCVTAIIWQTSNYQASEPAEAHTGCALASTSLTSMNHVEVQVSPTGLAVYMSDAGTTNMHLIASANVAVPLTQGLVWLEDVHYNGNKFGCPPACQQTDTFAWNDLAFDGPVLPRDAGFDVMDNTGSGPAAESGQPTTNIGYHINSTCCWATGTTANLQTATGPTSAQIAAASGAILTLNLDSGTKDIVYTVNGHVNTYAPPATATLALPVPLSEIVPGHNTIAISFGDQASGNLANVDLILVGAGGTFQP